MASFYRHKELIFLASMMIVFALIFFLGYASYKSNKAIIDIGIEAQVIDWIVMIFCVGAIARIVVLIKDIEIRKANN